MKKETNVGIIEKIILNNKKSDSLYEEGFQKAKELFIKEIKEWKNNLRKNKGFLDLSDVDNLLNRIGEKK